MAVSANLAQWRARGSRYHHHREFHAAAVNVVWQGYSFAQTKLEASSVLPEPEYFATSGYGHNGRVRSALDVASRLPGGKCDATMRSGALPFSTHCSITPT